MSCSLVTFTVKCADLLSSEGETISVVGSVPELGAWDPSKGTQLASHGAIPPPDWHAAVMLPLGAQFEFKFVKCRSDGYVLLEAFARHALVQAHPITLVCGEFGLATEPLVIAGDAFASKSMLEKASDAASSTKDAVVNTIMAAKNKVVGAADYVRDGASHTLHTVAEAIEPAHAQPIETEPEPEPFELN
jgi:hypothetical protein